MTQVAPSRILTDAVIARRAAGGNQRAFAAIFERYHQDLYRYCAAILGNAEDAHDAVQNTMLKVLRALPGETRELKLKPWLYRIAHNEAIDMIRVRRSAKVLEAEAIETEVLAGGAGPAEETETRVRLQQLISDIAELPTRQRAALVMREMSDLSYEQIGEALDTSPAVARQTIYEARMSLRQMSEGREMPCKEVMRAISDNDGRVLRRRDIRAHMLHCESCATFRAEISKRRQEFAALAPLPAAASAAILQGLLGGAGGTSAVGGAAGAAAGKALAGSAAVKSTAAVLAVSAIGVVAANQSGVIDLDAGGGHRPSVETAPRKARLAVGRTEAEVAQRKSLAESVKPEPLRRQEGRRGTRRAAVTVATAASHGSPPTPSGASPLPEQVSRSGGRHLGWSKGAHHGEGGGKPAHPSKGSESPGNGSSGQAKDHGQAKHAATEKDGGKAAAATHPEPPEHPAHPDHSQAGGAHGTEAGAGSGPEAGKGAHGDSPAE